MLCMDRMKFLPALAAFLFCVSIVRGDEQLFGFVRGAETLPAHHLGVYQFVTLGEGKSEGTYYGTHFETKPNMHLPINSRRAFRSSRDRFPKRLLGR